MSYSVVSRAKSVRRAGQLDAVREENRDRDETTNRDGMGMALRRGRGGKTGTGLGTGTGLVRSSLTNTGVGKSSSKVKVPSEISSTSQRGDKNNSMVLQKCATNQKASPPRSGQKTNYCHGAYSVTVPDQKKRSDLQKKAVAELAALEKLKRRNISQVSIIPSSVGGTLTQEEVRKKQQLAFDKAKAEQEETHTITGRMHRLLTDSCCD